MTDFESLPSPAFAPISRLDSYVWNLVALLLSGNEVLRLCKVGNSRLTACLVAGVRQLNLQWASHRYIAFDHVFSAIQRFPQVASVEFQPQFPGQLLWAPPPRFSLLPVLSSLKMSFFNAPSLMLHPQNDLKTALPALEHLSLTGDETQQSTNSSEIERSLDFRSLPPTLLSLRLSSQQPHWLDGKHLDLLSPSLQVLELELPCKVVTLESGGGTVVETIGAEWSGITRNWLVRHHAQAWPRSLTVLSLCGCQMIGTEWILDFSALPSCLKTLRIDEPSDGLNMVHGEHLTQLEEFEAPEWQMNPEETIALLNFIPSISRLTFPTYGAYLEDAEYRQAVLGKLVNLTEMQALTEETSNTFNTTPMPHLRDLTITSAKEIVLPESVTKLTCSACILTPNKRLEELIFKGYNFLHLKNPLPPTLVKVQFSTPMLMNDSILSLLPSSLEEITGHFDEKIWRSLMGTDGIPRMFPRLKAIHRSDVRPLSLESIREIPRQLRSMTFKLEPFSSASIDTSILHALKTSELAHLSIILSQKPNRPQMPSTIELLNNLPQNLESLHLETNCMLSRHWPVILPKKLSSLTFRVSWSIMDLEKYIPEDEKAVPTFFFPKNLTSLFFGDTKLPFTEKGIPQFLSFFHTYSDESVQEKYFLSRIPRLSYHTP